MWQLSGRQARPLLPFASKPQLKVSEVKTATAIGRAMAISDVVSKYLPEEMIAMPLSCDFCTIQRVQVAKTPL